MVNKRDTSKQKRARENRAQREARQARTEAASTPRPSRQAPAASSRAASAKKRSAASTAAPSSQRAPRAPRPPRAGDVPVDLDALQGNWYTKRLQVPGGRQVITGAALALVLTPLTALQKFPEAHTPKGQKVQYTQTISQFYGWAAIPLLAVPLLAALAAAWFIPSANRRRIWIGCSMLVSLGVIVGIPYVFPAGFLVYGVLRSNKVEGPTPGTRAARIAEERAAAADAKVAEEPAELVDDDES